jgi:hypothetical protein
MIPLAVGDRFSERYSDTAAELDVKSIGKK